MDEVLPWYRAMPAENRSWVDLVAQAGVAAFVEWFRHPEAPQAISADVFGTAPRELTRSVTLQQTVELVRVVIDVVEEQIEQIAPGHEQELREAVLRYSREIAFAAAQVYAQAAEARGAWDARLESLVVDALLRGEADDSLRSRAAALGWGSHDSAVVVVGQAPDAEPEAVVDDIRRAARAHRLDVLTGVQGDRLVAILGGPTDPVRATRHLVAQFGPGPVVVGPVVADLLGRRRRARRPRWPGCARPRPGRTRRGRSSPTTCCPSGPWPATSWPAAGWWRTSTEPLLSTGTALVETLAAYLEQTSSLEATARALFVHPNTVRYRLRRVAEVTGYTPSDPRHAFALRLALALGRLADGPRTAPRRPTVPDRSCREPTKTSRTSWSASAPPVRPRVRKGGPVLVIVAPGQGAQTPGFLRPWLELPHFEDRLRWLSACAGLDLVHYGTEADADTIRDTAVAQPLLVAAGLVSALEIFPHPADAFHAVGATAGHSVGEITAAAGTGVITAEQAMVLVRERGRAMADAAALKPTGMTAVLGGDPDEVTAALRAARAHRGQRQRRRPGRRRRHHGAARRAQGRPARQGPAGAAVGRRRLPHRAHGVRGRHPGVATPRRSASTTPAPG